VLESPTEGESSDPVLQACPTVVSPTAGLPARAGRISFISLRMSRSVGGLPFRNDANIVFATRYLTALSPQVCPDEFIGLPTIGGEDLPLSLAKVQL
jgi:hypothetical protein